MKGVEQSDMETVVNVREEIKRHVYELVVIPDKLPDSVELPGVHLDARYGGETYSEPATLTDEKKKGIKDAIEESVGRRPTGKLVRIDTDVQQTQIVPPPWREDEESQDEGYVYFQAKYESPINLVDSLDGEYTGDDFTGGKHDEEYAGIGFTGDTDDDMYEDIQQNVEQARETARGVQAAGDGVDFEATCNECGETLSEDVSLDESFCPECQQEVCQVDGCEERPDDFHDHMIAEHGWYDPSLDPTAEEEV